MTPSRPAATGPVAPPDGAAQFGPAPIPGSAGIHQSSAPADESGFDRTTLHGAGHRAPMQRRPPEAELPPELNPSRRRPDPVNTPQTVAYQPGGSMRPPGGASPLNGDSYLPRGRPHSAPGQPYPAPGALRRPPQQQPAGPPTPPRPSRASRAPERGLPGWGALIVFLAVCGIGGSVDVISGSKVRGAFNIAIVVAALIAILAVRHRSMFTIVIAPPLVYLAASAGMLFARGGLGNRQALYDEATNWLVYGFPAIAGATAAVLLVAGVRLIINR